MLYEVITDRGDQVMVGIILKLLATQVAMVLENACLFNNLNNSLRSLGKANRTIDRITSYNVCYTKLLRW